ncbi:MAG: outer membrane beta-barrel protein [Alphaproteobacteria bacterium]|nr:outer membrane beta-barrel protein [Alphaproteobacteria bacterium]
MGELPGLLTRPGRVKARLLADYSAGWMLTAGLLTAGCILPSPATAQLFQQYYTTPLLDQYLSPDVGGTADQPGVTVTSRYRPAYDYLGVRLGSFMLHAEGSEKTGYDDNVTGTPNGRGSFLAQTTGTLSIASDWSRGSLAGNLVVDDYRYPDQNQESYTNWSGTLSGSHQFGRDTLLLNYAHSNSNQNSRDLGVPQLDTPIAFRVDDGTVTYRANFARSFLQSTLDIAGYSYDNGTVLGTPFTQAYRNRILYSPGVALGYELAPLRNVVLVARDSQAEYSQLVPGVPLRNYNDGSVLAGIDFLADGVFRYRLFGGYEIRKFENSAYQTIQAPIVEAALIYTPTGLTTISGIASRRIQDSVSDSTVGLTETALQLRVDHEYLRNVILQARAGYFIDDYSQNQGSQTLLQAGVGVTWLLNRNMRLAATYDYANRGTSSNGFIGLVNPNQNIGTGYTENRFLIQLKVGL